MTRSRCGYVTAYAVEVGAVLILIGDNGLDISRLHRESRAFTRTVPSVTNVRNLPGPAWGGGAGGWFSHGIVTMN